MLWDERIDFWLALYLKLLLQKQLNRVRHGQGYISYSFWVIEAIEIPTFALGGC